MRILMVNTLYPPIVHGGEEKFVALLAESLVRAGDEVSVVTLHNEKDELSEVRNGVRVHRIPLDNIYWPFDPHQAHGVVAKLRWHANDTWNRKASERVGRILDQERPQLVHTHGLSGFSVAVWAEAKRRNLRLVHTLHNFYLLCKNSALFRDGEACRGRCRECAVVTAPRRWAAPRVNALVSVSQYVLDAHRRYRYFQRTPATVIYNIVESKAGVESNTGAPRRQTRGDTVVFGFIGRLEQEKGIDVILKAARHLRSRPWRLRIAGAGKDAYVSALKRNFADPRIEWLGFVDPRGFYDSVDVVVIPSVWPEPMGRIVVEAFAAGKSAVCARSGGIPEIAAYGRQVETYPAGDVAALAEVMNRVLADPQPWRQGGYRDEAAKNAFSEDDIIDRYREVYSSLGMGECS